MPVFGVRITRTVSVLSVVDERADLAIEAKNAREARKIVNQALKDGEYNIIAGVVVDWEEIDREDHEEQDIEGPAITLVQKA